MLEYPKWSVLATPAPAIGIDTSLLLAAASFIEPLSGNRDPQHDVAFEAVSTAYCNGAELYLPLPRSQTEEVPLFLDLWRQDAMTKVPNLELSDPDFERVAAALAGPFATFVNGSPGPAARWVRFNFAPNVAEGHLSRADADSILRAGPVARQIMDRNGLDRFTRALEKLQDDDDFKGPPSYAHLIGTHETPSFHHLCAAYALSVCVRGYSYWLKLGSTGADVGYRYHWIRGPATHCNELIGHEIDREEAPAWFPWGAILARVFALESPLVSRAPKRVAEVLQALREGARSFRSQLGASEASVLTQSSRVTDEEVLCLDTLRAAGLVLPYRRAVNQDLLDMLRTCLEMAPPQLAVPIRHFASKVPLGWASGLESTARIKLHRDGFWEVFGDLGVRRAVRAGKSKPSPSTGTR